MLQDFKNAVREKEPRWTVREFQYDEVALEEEKKHFEESTEREQKAKNN